MVNLLTGIVMKRDDFNSIQFNLINMKNTKKVEFVGVKKLPGRLVQNSRLESSNYR